MELGRKDDFDCSAHLLLVMQSSFSKIMPLTCFASSVQDHQSSSSNLKSLDMIAIEEIGYAYTDRNKNLFHRLQNIARKTISHYSSTYGILKFLYFENRRAILLEKKGINYDGQYCAKRPIQTDDIHQFNVDRVELQVPQIFTSEQLDLSPGDRDRLVDIGSKLIIRSIGAKGLVLTAGISSCRL